MLNIIVSLKKYFLRNFLKQNELETEIGNNISSKKLETIFINLET